MAPPWEELSRVSVTEVGRHFEFVPTPLPPLLGRGHGLHTAFAPHPPFPEKKKISSDFA